MKAIDIARGLPTKELLEISSKLVSFYMRYIKGKYTIKTSVVRKLSYCYNFMCNQSLLEILKLSTIAST